MILLAQWNVTEWGALIGAAGTILGGLVNIVVLLTRMNTKLDRVAGTQRVMRKIVKKIDARVTVIEQKAGDRPAA